MAITIALTQIQAFGCVRFFSSIYHEVVRIRGANSVCGSVLITCHSLLIGSQARHMSILHKVLPLK